MTDKLGKLDDERVFLQIDERTYRALRDYAEKNGITVEQALDRALDEHVRKLVAS